MTLYVPLGEQKALPPAPSFLREPADHETAVSGVVKAIMKAKRIIVVCGAGISVDAGIPDFRSPAGLFQTLKRDHPKENLSSGKDLFDASVFNSEQMTALFCQMIAQLSDMSTAASPTPFHQLLRALDDSGKLLRVYTQNIDAIEAKSGLSFGVPAFDDRRHKSRATPAVNRPTSLDPPRCVPLHGTLTRLYCMTCTYSCALTDFLPSLAAGAPPLCPSCSDTAVVRAAEGKRARAIGKLRPSVVLYGEAHADAEGVGDVVRRDLTHRSGPDLLLVAGTSLRVPGTKRIVREFAKAVRVAAGVEPLPSPRGTPGADSPITSVYLNLDFPVPAREWGDVFDVWVNGDAQSFAGEVQRELDEEVRRKAARAEKRMAKEEARQREEMAVCKKGVKRKARAQSATPAKRRRVDAMPTPPKTPKYARQGTKVTPSSRRSRTSSKTDKAPDSRKLTVRIPARPPPSPASPPPSPTLNSGQRRSLRLSRSAPDVFPQPAAVQRRQPPSSRPIPEVVITRAPWQTSKNHPAFARGRPPPTPDRSPPRPCSPSESDSEGELINVMEDAVDDTRSPAESMALDDEDVDVEVVDDDDERDALIPGHVLHARDLYGSSDGGYETGSDTDTDDELPCVLPAEQYEEGGIPRWKPPSSARYVNGKLLLGRTVPLQESFLRTSGTVD
ncbi:DHS-like NAD/FAD-binding domain-containing protein [Schizophyllum commune Tattone D]|nr:DHS-like NAD/FAD-binding domain-containing protein [Schizophyllum commune Tattone D]